MTPHSVTVKPTIEDCVLRANFEFRCNAPEGADCRISCTQGCESWSLTDHEHPLRDYGHCLLVEWLDNADDYDIVDSCTSREHALVDGLVILTYVPDGLIEWAYVE